MLSLTECPLTSTRSTHKSEIMKLGDAILGERTSVSYLAAAVLFVARLDLDHGAIFHLGTTEYDHLEGAGQCFVRSPVGGQLGAQDVGRAGAYELRGIGVGHGCSRETVRFEVLFQ